MATLAEQKEYKDQVARANEAFRSGNIAGARASTKTANDILNASYGGGAYEQPQPVDPYAEIKRQQEALLAAQKQQRINALGQQRQSALSALEAERGTVAPVYLQQRGQLSTTAQQTARGAEQSLAARGLTRGGSAVQGDIARNVALQQGMTDIGAAEAGTLANIAQRQTAAEQAYQQGLAQAESEAAATAAQNEIARLMQAQQAQESAVANEAKTAFEQQKMDQEQANKLQIEQLKLAGEQALKEGDFKRAQELAKFKSDLEAETIKLRASTKSSGGGGGGSSSGGGSTNLNTTQRAQASAIGKQIDARPGELRTILNRVTDPAVKAYLQAIYGTPSVSGVAASPTEWNFAKAYSKSQGVEGY